MLRTTLRVHVQGVLGATHTKGLNFLHWGLDGFLGSGIVFEKSTPNKVK